MASRRARDKALMDERSRIYANLCKDKVEAGSRSMSEPLSAESLAALNRTNKISFRDPCGDGDQSPLSTFVFSFGHHLRNAWTTGLDAQTAVRKEDPDVQFHLSCFLGLYNTTKNMIQEARDKVAAGETEALTQLLEKRFSLMRFSPLHYVVYGSKVLSDFPLALQHSRWNEVAETLIEAGARIEARDVCGHTPLGMAAGAISTTQSLNLVPVLLKHGADVNSINRYGEVLLFQPLMANNHESFRALLWAGADSLIVDYSGMTPREMAMKSPELMNILTEIQRELMMEKMKCETCGKKGARKHCSKCRKVYYCSRECQVKGWRDGHRSLCQALGDEQAGEYLDIVVKDMTTDKAFPGMNQPLVFQNSITGATSKKKMKAKEIGVAFVVKVSRPLIDGGSVKINTKNSDFLLIGDEGPGQRAHESLYNLCKLKGLDAGKVYLSAKWIEMKTKESGSSKDSDVLRLDVSRVLLPPKPSW